MSHGQRGITKIHNALFVTETEQEKRSKGRSEKFIFQRNECLLDRYLYYGRTTEKRYDIILKELSIEFFLSEITIAKLLNCNYTQLSSLKKSYADLTEVKLKKHLQSKWPYQNWL